MGERADGARTAVILDDEVGLRPLPTPRLVISVYWADGQFEARVQGINAHGEARKCLLWASPDLADVLDAVAIRAMFGDYLTEGDGR